MTKRTLSDVDKALKPHCLTIVDAPHVIIMTGLPGYGVLASVDEKAPCHENNHILQLIA